MTSRNISRATAALALLSLLLSAVADSSS
ncbi:hypothetical protein L195_g064265, partial [Trifolium pratense]